MTNVLFLHGIKSDPAAAQWELSLDSALGRRGNGRLADRGVVAVGASWRDELERATHDENLRPPLLTYAKTSDDTYDHAVGSRSLEQATLERALRRRGTLRPGSLGTLSDDALDMLAPPLASRVLKDVGNYCREAGRRHACLHAVLEQVPRDDDIIVIAHSLGSVLALDLIYHLPAEIDVKLLITVGSPLGRDVVRRHLRRVRDRFPAERVGPWLNVVGQWDPVAAGRGIARHFPEALDVFVDTGSTTAHDAARYLDQDVVADAIDVALIEPSTTAGHGLEKHLNDRFLPALLQSQMALRIEQRMDVGDRRTRFGRARAVRAADIRDQLGFEPSMNLAADHSERLRGRFLPAKATEVLLETCMSNVIAPYEIDYEGKAEDEALERLAGDMGYESNRARCVLAAEREAREYHGAKGGWQRKALLAAGLAALVAAPYLVAAAAPAGLAGGASIMAGLAALGPGGMVGGLGMVGLVGGAGGAAIAGGLTAGSAGMVEERVIFLHALALAEQKLHEGHHRAEIWVVLVAMETTLAAEHERLNDFSDERARILKELGEKRATVAKAIRGLGAAGLAPRMLDVAEDEDGRERPFAPSLKRLRRGD
jgi:hypothetical protein